MAVDVPISTPNLNAAYAAFGLPDYTTAIRKLIELTNDPSRPAVNYDGKSLSPDQLTQMQIRLMALKNSPNLAAIRAYARGEKYDPPDNFSASGETLRKGIVDELTKSLGTQVKLANEQDAQAMLAVLENPERLMADIRAVEAAKTQSAPAQVQQPVVTPPADANANAAQRSEELRKVIQLLQTNFLGMPDGTGEFNGPTDAKLQQCIRDMQTKAKTLGYDGPVDGVYSQKFRFFVSKRHDDLAAFGQTMDRFVALGGQVGSAASPAPSSTASPSAGSPTATPGSTAGAPNGGPTPPTTPTDPNAPLPPLGPLMKPEDASKGIKQFLTQVAGGMNAKIEALQGAGMFGMIFLSTGQIPLPTDPDGKFDAASNASLQSVLKAFQIQLDLTDDEIINYTPDVGDKIRRNFPKIAKSLKPDQKKALDDAGGIDKIVLALNSLKAANMLQNQKLFDDNAGIKLSGIGINILQMLMGFVQRMFPGAFPSIKHALDDKVRLFTGGLGINDLMPQSKQDKDLPVGIALPSEEQLANNYLKALKAAKEEAGPNAKPEEVQAKLHNILQQFDRGLPIFPTDQASQQMYLNAFDKAYAAAQQAQGDEAAAAAYAKTFLANYDVTLTRDPETGRTRVADPQLLRIVKDPSVLDFRVGSADFNAIYDAYDKLSALENSLYSTQKPMVFKRPEDDTLWVAGMAGNIFTVKQLTPQEVAMLKEAAAQGGGPDVTKALINRAAADEKLQGLHLLVGGYSKYMSLEALQGEVDNATAFERTKAVIEMRVGNERGARLQEGIRRQNDEAYQARRNALFGDPGQHPGVDQERLREGLSRDREIGERAARFRGADAIQAANRGHATMEVLTEREAARKTGPQLLRTEFEENGQRRIVLLTFDDPTGYAIAATKAGRDRNSALKEEFFGTHPVDKDFWQFRRDLAAYVASRGSELKGLSMHAQVLEYQRFHGDTFAERYTQLAEISRLPGYRGTQFENNIGGLYEYIDRMASRYVGTETSPVVAYTEPEPTGGYVASEQTARQARTNGNHRYTPGHGPSYRNMGESWNPLARWVFNMHARHKDQPAAQADDRSVSSPRQDGSVDTRLDPRRPVAPIPDDPDYVDPVAPESIFPNAAASKTGGTAAGASDLFRENGEHVATRVSPEEKPPEDIFPAAKSALDTTPTRPFR